MKILAKEQKQEYLKNPVNCPYCGSDDIEADCLEDDEYRGVLCHVCGSHWIEVFKLVDIEEDNY